jgi:histidinol dehydrogenase
MSTILNICRIDCASEDAREAILELRRQLSPKGNVVSPQGRARTIAAFGEALTPQQVVERVCADVQCRGLEAVLEYTAKFDGVTLEPCEVRVPPESLVGAYLAADHDYLETLRRVRHNILAFQTGILNRDAMMRSAPGTELRLRYRPLRRVGVCIPGGAAAYPSSLLMTVIPA